MQISIIVSLRTTQDTSVHCLFNGEFNIKGCNVAQCKQQCVSMTMGINRENCCNGGKGFPLHAYPDNVLFFTDGTEVRFQNS